MIIAGNAICEKCAAIEEAKWTLKFAAYSICRISSFKVLHAAFAAHWSKVLHFFPLHTKGSLNTSLICGCPLCVGLSGAALAAH